MVESIKASLNKLNDQTYIIYMYINNYRVETRSIQHSKKFELNPNMCLSSTKNAQEVLTLSILKRTKK